MDIKLGNPIKEIVLSISFDRKLDIEKLREFCENGRISSDFPVFSPGYDAKVKLSDSPSSEFNHTGYILKSKGENRSILNLKLGKISFHIIDRYLSFTSILEQLDEYWAIFQQIFGIIEITNVSVRYINQIEVDKGENFEDYINVSIKTPFDNIQGQFVNFTLSPKFSDNNVKSNVIIANSKDKNLILDLIIEKHLDKLKLKKISDVFLDLRPLKNNIFQSLVTEKTKQKFEL